MFRIMQSLMLAQKVKKRFEDRNQLLFLIIPALNRVLRSQENLENSGNFCLIREFFHTFIVFAPSISVHMLINFLGPLKAAGKNVESQEIFLRGILRPLFEAFTFLSSVCCTQY